MTLIIPYYPSIKTLNEFKVLIKSIYLTKQENNINIILINHENVSLPIEWKIYIHKNKTIVKNIDVSISNNKYYLTHKPESFWAMIPEIYNWCKQELEIENFIFTEPDIMFINQIKQMNFDNDIIAYNNSSFTQINIVAYVVKHLLKKYNILPEYEYTDHYDSWFIYNLDINQSQLWKDLTYEISYAVDQSLFENHSLILQHLNEEIALSMLMRKYSNNSNNLSVNGEENSNIINSVFYHYDMLEEGLNKINSFNNFKECVLCDKFYLSTKNQDITEYLPDLNYFVEYGILDKTSKYYDILSNILAIDQTTQKRYKYSFKNS